MPYANFRDLELDRRLNRIDDLVTVELLTSFIMWKLRGTEKPKTMFPSWPPIILPGSRQRYLII